MTTKRKFLDPTLQSRGDYDAPPGSEAWATAVRLEIQEALDDHTQSVKDLEAWLKAIQDRKGWKVLYDANGQHFQTYEQFAREKPPWGLGHEPVEVDQIIQSRKTAQELGSSKPMRKEGRPRKEDKGDTVTFTRGTNGSSYLAARIARDRPDILERMKAGKYDSVRAAAIDAGIVKVPTSLESAQKAFLKLSKDERETFLIWVSAL